VILGGIGGGAFLFAFFVGLLPLPLKIRAPLVPAGPVAAVVVFLAAAPEPQCTSDCSGRFAWALAAGAGAIGWLVGVCLSFAIRAVVGAARARGQPVSRRSS
jgi:hypothetical protein